MAAHFCFRPMPFGLAVLMLIACGGSDNSSIANGEIDNDAGVEQGVESLTLTLETEIEVGDEVMVVLELKRDDQIQSIEAEELAVVVDNPEVLRANPDAPLTLEAIAPGETTIKYTLGMLESNTVTVTVGAVGLNITEIRVTAETTEAEIGQTLQLSAIGYDEAGNNSDLSSLVTWASAKPSVAIVDDAGLVEIATEGRAGITATYNELSAEIKVGSRCNYPSYDRQIGLNSTFPPLAWADAHDALGNVQPYSLRELFCDPETAPTTIAVIVGAGWCSACTSLTVNILKPIIDSLTQANMQVLYIEAEDGQYEPASSLFAFRHLARLIGEDPGIRVGDMKTSLNADSGPWTNEDEFIRSLSNGSYPSAWVVRTSDMKVIADQNTSQYWLPFLLIAQEPDADWSEPPPPPPPPFESNCEEGDDEASEPNNTSIRAARLNEGSQSGGICTPEPDFYRVQASGPWRVTLEFSHDVGDLDMYLWDKDANDVMVDESGMPIASNGEADTETIESQGNGIISIVGYGGASNVYNLILELLE
jgi:hypothetical protein